jgi:TRAP-type mannitol/chloroaromatic compound transport system permease small subunit
MDDHQFLSVEFLGRFHYYHLPVKTLIIFIFTVTIQQNVTDVIIQICVLHGK